MQGEEVDAALDVMAGIVLGVLRPGLPARATETARHALIASMTRKVRDLPPVRPQDMALFVKDMARSLLKKKGRQDAVATVHAQFDARCKALRRQPAAAPPEVPEAVAPEWWSVAAVGGCAWNELVCGGAASMLVEARSYVESVAAECGDAS
jgi:hypothetical protein